MNNIYNIFKSNIKSDIISIDSEFVEIVIFPDNIGITAIEGKYLFNNDIDDNIYICGEDSLKILLDKVLTNDKSKLKSFDNDILKKIKSIFSLNDLVNTLSINEYKRVVLDNINDINQPPATFIPLSTVLGRLLLCMHLVIDNKTKSELLKFITSAVDRSSDNFPITPKSMTPSSRSPNRLQFSFSNSFSIADDNTPTLEIGTSIDNNSKSDSKSDDTLVASTFIALSNESLGYSPLDTVRGDHSKAFSFNSSCESLLDGEIVCKNNNFNSIDHNITPDRLLHKFQTRTGITLDEVS